MRLAPGCGCANIGKFALLTRKVTVKEERFGDAGKLAKWPGLERRWYWKSGARRWTTASVARQRWQPCQRQATKPFCPRFALRPHCRPQAEPLRALQVETWRTTRPHWVVAWLLRNAAGTLPCRQLNTGNRESCAVLVPGECLHRSLRDIRHCRTCEIRIRPCCSTSNGLGPCYRPVCFRALHGARLSAMVCVR